jgi:hypothetical protein
MLLSSFSRRAQNGQSASEKIASRLEPFALDLLDREIERQGVERDARELAHLRVRHVLLGRGVEQIADDDERHPGVGVHDLVVEHDLVQRAIGALDDAAHAHAVEFLLEQLLDLGAFLRERRCLVGRRFLGGPVRGYGEGRAQRKRERRPCSAAIGSELE